mmetsp:Transcript_6539/g.26631  ORF Transcript_6539/g.26631 Transcript_6539/m.26631 type:complete len:227 (+) Transcript_6539:2445-3125(+)
MSGASVTSCAAVPSVPAASLLPMAVAIPAAVPAGGAKADAPSARPTATRIAKSSTARPALRVGSLFECAARSKLIDTHCSNTLECATVRVQATAVTIVASTASWVVPSLFFAAASAAFSADSSCSPPASTSLSSTPSKSIRWRPSSAAIASLRFRPAQASDSACRASLRKSSSVSSVTNSSLSPRLVDRSSAVSAAATSVRFHRRGAAAIRRRDLNSSCAAPARAR